MSITGTAPEQGQLVLLRNRYFIVEDIRGNEKRKLSFDKEHGYSFTIGFRK